MAKSMAIVFVSLFLVLSCWTQYGLGIPFSNIHQAKDVEYSINIYNGADDMTIQNTYSFTDGTSRTDPPRLLLKSTTYQSEVENNMNCVATKYTMPTATGQLYFQTLNSWCITGMPIACEDCFWVVDTTGFSLAAAANAQLTHVANWNLHQ